MLPLGKFRIKATGIVALTYRELLTSSLLLAVALIFQKWIGSFNSILQMIRKSTFIAWDEQREVPPDLEGR